jgi:hypothetical protein
VHSRACGRVYNQAQSGPAEPFRHPTHHSSNLDYNHPLLPPPSLPPFPPKSLSVDTFLPFPIVVRPIARRHARHGSRIDQHGEIQKRIGEEARLRGTGRTSPWQAHKCLCRVNPPEAQRQADTRLSVGPKTTVWVRSLAERSRLVHDQMTAIPDHPFLEIVRVIPVESGI